MYKCEECDNDATHYEKRFEQDNVVVKLCDEHKTEKSTKLPPDPVKQRKEMNLRKQRVLAAQRTKAAAQQAQRRQKK